MARRTVVDPIVALELESSRQMMICHAGKGGRSGGEWRGQAG